MATNGGVPVVKTVLLAASLQKDGIALFDMGHWPQIFDQLWKKFNAIFYNGIWFSSIFNWIYLNYGRRCGQHGFLSVLISFSLVISLHVHEIGIRYAWTQTNRETTQTNGIIWPITNNNFGYWSKFGEICWLVLQPIPFSVSSLDPKHPKTTYFRGDEV